MNARLYAHLRELKREVDELDAQIQAWRWANAASVKLSRIPRIGPMTASALVATHDRLCPAVCQRVATGGLAGTRFSPAFQRGKTHVARHHQAGCYLRTLLIHGARAVIRGAERKAHDARGWLANLVRRRSKNVAAVALVNKNARVV